MSTSTSEPLVSPSVSVVDRLRWVYAGESNVKHVEDHLHPSRPEAFRSWTTWKWFGCYPIEEEIHKWLLLFGNFDVNVLAMERLGAVVKQDKVVEKMHARSKTHHF